MLKLISFILLLGVFGFVTGRFVKHKSLYPFMPFRYDFRKRRDTFRKVLELLDLNNAKIIIETGTSRSGLKGSKSQGAATIVFGKWAKQNGAILHSVDISQNAVNVAMAEVGAQKLENNVTIHLSDSLEFLRRFKEPVDFLYLDSYEYSEELPERTICQEHHLNEFKLIENRLHNNSIVLIDDCGLPGGGKGKKVIDYMIPRGWKIIISKYQVLLLHKDSSVFREHLVSE